MHGGVTGKAREGLPMSIQNRKPGSQGQSTISSCWGQSAMALPARRGLRHEAQGARHKEKMSFLLLFLPCGLYLEP
jgi:hypothetical protein